MNELTDRQNAEVALACMADKGIELAARVRVFKSDPQNDLALHLLLHSLDAVHFWGEQFKKYQEAITPPHNGGASE